MALTYQMPPNPSFERTSRIKPREAAQLQRYASFRNTRSSGLRTHLALHPSLAFRTLFPSSSACSAGARLYACSVSETPRANRRVCSPVASSSIRVLAPWSLFSFSPCYPRRITLRSSGPFAIRPLTAAYLHVRAHNPSMRLMPACLTLPERPRRFRRQNKSGRRMLRAVILAVLFARRNRHHAPRKINHRHGVEGVGVAVVRVAAFLVEPCHTVRHVENFSVSHHIPPPCALTLRFRRPPSAAPELRRWASEP